MYTLLRRFLTLVLAIVVLAACASPTAVPAPTMIPTEPPTSTAVPHTATSVPTNTPLPPTKTPQPTATLPPTNTATPLPTNTPKPSPTKVVTPKPTNTKGASAPVSTGGGVSSKPSTLQKSIEQSFSVAQDLVGLLNQMVSGGSVEMCTSLIAKYQGIHNAPTYDVTGQAPEVQNAYAAYRNGISLVDTVGEKILGCGRGGGTLGSLELGTMQFPLSNAVSSFAQALDLIKSAPGISTLSPLEDAVVRTLRAVEGVGDAVNKLLPDQWGSTNRRVAADDPRCIEAINSHNAIPNFTMDPTGQLASVQAAYQLYQEAMKIYQVEVSNFPKACAAGEVTVSPVGFGNLHKNVEAVLNKLRQASAALK